MTDEAIGELAQAAAHVAEVAANVDESTGAAPDDGINNLGADGATAEVVAVPVSQVAEIAVQANEAEHAAQSAEASATDAEQAAATADDAAQAAQEAAEIVVDAVAVLEQASAEPVDALDEPATEIPIDEVTHGGSDNTPDGNGTEATSSGNGTAASAGSSEAATGTTQGQPEQNPARSSRVSRFRARRAKRSN